MSWWPWVSREAYNQVLKENKFLRKQFREMAAHKRRVERKASGMPENPRTSEQVDREEDIPRSVAELISGYESEAMRAAIADDVRRARRAGTPWGAIEDLLAEDAYSPTD